MIAMRLTHTVLAAALIAVLHVLPVQAADFFVSQQNGNDANNCSFATPCRTMSHAVSVAEVKGSGYEIACLDSGEFDTGSPIIGSVTIDCSGTGANVSLLVVQGNIGSDITVTLRNITINRWGGSPAIAFNNGTLILDNVHLSASADAILAQPTGPSNLVVKNSIFESNSAGIVIKPASGGSLTAKFDHVTISHNSGGGIKTDSTNGPVTVDITDSTISDNGGNGLNAVGGAGGPAIFNIHNSVIATNGVAGIQVNGATAAVMIDTTLLDSNTSGATSVVNGGHTLTYGNNRIVGTAGSGFTGSAPLQ